MQFIRLALALAAVLSLAPAHAAGGNVADGEKKAAMCIGCHGIPSYQASFPEVYKVPMISGQNAAYIAKSLEAYAKGERKHPTMRGIAGSLSEQDMADLGAFYAQQGTPKQAPEQIPAATPDVAKLLDKGACVSCHGANFSKALSPEYPKLAGQHADYLYVALKSYQSSAATHGRSNGIMQGQVKQYTHAELKAMAKYIGSLGGELQTVPQSRFR